MRRVLLLVIPGLLVVAVVIVSMTRQTSDDGSSARADGLTADTMPFPRAATPLRVPEVRIDEGPWSDGLPQDSAPTLPPGFTERSTSCLGTGGSLSGAGPRTMPLAPVCPLR